MWRAQSDPRYFLVLVITSAWAPVSSKDLTGFFFFSVVCTYTLPLFSDLDHFVPILNSAHPVAKNSSNQFQWDKADGSCRSDRINIISFSLKSVPSICYSHGLKISRCSVMDPGSVENSTRRRPTWKQMFFSGTHLS